MQRQLTVLASMSVGLCLLALGNTQAEGLSGLQIMQKNDQVMRTDTEFSRLTYTLISSNGRQQVRMLEIYSKARGPKEEHRLLEFVSPPDVKGTKLLTYDYQNKDDDQWLYLPALGTVRRIGAVDQTERFMGTDFTYEDMQDFDLESWHYQLLGEDRCADRLCYQLQARPQTPSVQKISGYSKRLLWVDKETYLVLRSDFFDKHDQLVKRLLASDVRQAPDSTLFRAYHVEMEDLLRLHKTLIQFQLYQINQAVPNQIFNPRYLSR